MAQAAIDVGSIVADTYEVTGLLGEGGMGAVWAARHLRLRGKKVAIKLLHAMIARDTEAMARFEREAQIASQLGHPNIVKVEDFNQMPDGTAYLVLEFLEGESLAERLSRGPLHLAHALSIARQIGSALQAAHNADIVHRDLKPHNVFLSPTEAGGYAAEQVKVLDFGISKIHGSETVKTQTHAILGTPQYMSPEQAKGAHHEIDGRTDQFALGAIVYEMLTGGSAFAGSTIPEVMFKVVYEEPQPLAERVPMTPKPVITAIERALAKEREARFPSVSAFIEALTGDPLTTLNGGPATAAMQSPHLSPSLAALVASSQSGGAAAGQAADASQSIATAATMAGQPGATPAQKSSPEAFAQTMAPGPAASVAASGAAAHSGAMSAVQAAVTPTAAGHVGVSPYGMADTTPDVGKPSSAGQPRGKGRMVAILVGLCVLLVVGVVVLGLDGADGLDGLDGDSADQPIAQAGDASATAAVAPPKAIDTAPDTTMETIDAGATAAAVTADATPPPADDTRAATAATDGDGDGDGDRDGDRDGDQQARGGGRMPPKIARELKQLDRLVESDPMQAIRQARDYLSQEADHPRTVKQSARMIMARAYCTKGDLSGARANIRSLRGRARRAVIRYCDGKGLDLR